MEIILIYCTQRSHQLFTMHIAHIRSRRWRTQAHERSGSHATSKSNDSVGVTVDRSIVSIRFGLPSIDRVSHLQSLQSPRLGPAQHVCASSQTKLHNMQIGVSVMLSPKIILLINFGLAGEHFAIFFQFSFNFLPEHTIEFPDYGT